MVEKQPNEGNAKGCKQVDMLIGGQHVVYITWDAKPVTETHCLKAKSLHGALAVVSLRGGAVRQVHDRVQRHALPEPLRGGPPMTICKNVVTEPF